MGVGFHVDGHECKASWSYLGFHAFRKRLANTIGIDLENMQGFSKKHPDDINYVKTGIIPWDNVRSPLKYLLDHSDCDGEISSKQCGWIWPILEKIIDLWESSSQNEYDILQASNLIVSMKYCYVNNKPLEFF